MWFKNVKAYQITQPLSLDEGDLERALNEHAFRPCGSQDLATMGFASPFSQAGKQGTMFHVVQQRFVFFAGNCFSKKTNRKIL